MAQTFSVRRGGALSLHSQLLEQLKHHIEERTWVPGAQLPPAQHLAGSLGIDPNTVRAVYRELERAGYVVSAQGRGTFVAADSPSTKDEMQRINDLLDEVVLYAQQMGLSPDDLARHAFLRARMFAPRSLLPRMVFIECTASDVRCHARTIAQGTGVKPTEMLVSELSRGTSAFKRFDLVVTTLFHAEEVQAALGPERKIVTLMLEPSFEQVVGRLLPLARGVRVAVACTTRARAVKFVSSLLVRGLDHLRYEPVGIEDREAFGRAFRRAHHVWVSQAVRETWKGPWPAERPVYDFVQVIDTTSLRLLRRVVGSLEESRDEPKTSGVSAARVSGGTPVPRQGSHRDPRQSRTTRRSARAPEK